MKPIPHTDRFCPAYEGEISELISEVRFTPFSAGCAPRTPGWLYLSTLGLLRNYGGWFHVRITEELVRVMQAHSIFAPTLETAYQDHHLDLTTRGDRSVCLFLDFAQVSGTYNLMRLSEEDLQELLKALDAAKEASHG